MNEKNLFYRSPSAYRLGLVLLHRRAYMRRNRIIAGEVGVDVSVLDVGCGPAFLAAYLDRSCTYTGFDPNEDFLRFAKRRGRDVRRGDAVDEGSYRNTDCVVCCDLIHHLDVADHAPLFALLVRHARRRLIVSEPTLPDTFAFHGLRYRLLKSAVRLLERDGMNRADLDTRFTESELRARMEDGFLRVPTAAPRRIQRCGVDLIVTYDLEQRRR